MFEWVRCKSFCCTKTFKNLSKCFDSKVQVAYEPAEAGRMVTLVCLTQSLVINTLPKKLDFKRNIEIKTENLVSGLETKNQADNIPKKNNLVCVGLYSGGT